MRYSLFHLIFLITLIFFNSCSQEGRNENIQILHTLKSDAYYCMGPVSPPGGYSYEERLFRKVLLNDTVKGEK